uniref:Heat shock protein family A member 4 n=1 Tax=Urechis unicinctus TaxID=6432 RepID=A0AAU0MTJ4_UREUN
MSVVGIDMGYQTCFIAVARQGGIETIANEYSDRCTPAYVSYSDKQRSMGASSKNAIMSNLKNSVWGWKPLVGRTFTDPIVKTEKDFLPYEVVEGPCGTTGIKVMYLGESQVFTPEQVTATILTKLKDTAEIGLKIKVVDCVISVPVYFSDTQRRAMLGAAQMAGLNVLRLMNDTTATALAYGIYKQDLPAPEEKPRNVVFVDMGHADLQIAACAFNKGKLKVMASTSDSQLGGRDFDRILSNHFAEDFKKRYKVDAMSKPRAYVRLLLECEKLKKLMSANSTEIPLNIECFMDDKDVSGRMKRAQLEELAASQLKRVEEQMRGIMDLANLKPVDLYAVEIVGGCSRVPAVKQLVKEVFGMESSTTLNADESVARGCALQCAILSPTFRVRDFSIQDAQPYPVILHWQGSMDEDSQDMEVFGKFHQVPFSKMLTFYRREPFSIDAKYSAADYPGSSPVIGSFLVDKVVPQNNGESSKIKVKVRVNINGTFNVSSASLIEKLEDGPEEEAMEVENGPAGQEGQNKDATEVKTETKVEEGAPAAAATEGDKAGGEEAPMQTDEKKEDAKAESSKKKKKTIKTIDLPVFAQVPELDKDQLNLLVEKEGQMRMADKLEKERVDAKNSVEEYVYEMRDKLCGNLEKYIKEDDRDQFTLKLEDTENWLYEEGEDCNKQVYIDRLTMLKKIGQPVVDRYREAETRPAAFEEMGQCLQMIRKALDSYNNKEETYAHIEAADMEKVSKAVKEKAELWEKNLNLCNQTPLYETAPITTAQIKAHQAVRPRLVHCIKFVVDARWVT